LPEPGGRRAGSPLFDIAETIWERKGIRAMREINSSDSYSYITGTQN
jgi:hypothetical protein